jgi:hypothetical protein
VGGLLWTTQRKKIDVVWVFITSLDTVLELGLPFPNVITKDCKFICASSSYVFTRSIGDSIATL